MRVGSKTALVCLILVAVVTGAAELPVHRELRILIVSDEVNPHVLPAGDLTQPGELSSALAHENSGVHIDPAGDGMVEIATNDIEQATALLSVPFESAAAYDVLVYFAHRIPDNMNNDQARQDAFTAAVDAFLHAGGGVVSFHHGAYLTPGKESIQELIGATATGNVFFNTIDGQNVINTAPDHWITCQSVEYPNAVVYQDVARGVPSATYPFFNNTPDERYPSFVYNASALGNVQTLFGSNFNQNGTTHLLGWIHRRPAWLGRVVGYQPGEYQPLALDDPDGNNFQILTNAIVFSAGAIPSDQIVLELDKTAGGVDLNWSACDGTFAVYRSSDPTNVPAPANELIQTTAGTLSDSPGGGLFFYLVERL